MKEGASGWAKALAGSVLAALIGMGGIWVNEMKANAIRDSKIDELMEFKQHAQQLVEDARAEHATAASEIAAMKAQMAQSVKERRAIYRWIDMVAAQLHVAPPALPDQGGGTGGSGGKR